MHSPGTVYRRIHGSFWTGTTGRELRATGHPEDYVTSLECRVVATYLMTSPHSTMSGIYHLPLGYAAIDTGLPVTSLVRAIQRLQEMGFCVYDPDLETVWVCEMAKYQVDGELKGGDKRRRAIAMQLDSLGDSPIVPRFLARYGRAFGLDSTTPHTSRDLSEIQDAPPGGASMGGVPPHKSQKQNQIQNQNQVRTTPKNQNLEKTEEHSKESRSRSRAGAQKRTHRRPRDLILSGELLEFATSRGMPERKAREEWDRMGDHEFRVPKSDWPAAWRQWVRTALERGGASEMRPVARAPRFAAEVSQSVADRLRGGGSTGHLHAVDLETLEDVP